MGYRECTYMRGDKLDYMMTVLNQINRHYDHPLYSLN